MKLKEVLEVPSSILTRTPSSAEVPVAPSYKQRITSIISLQQQIFFTLEIFNKHIRTHKIEIIAQGDETDTVISVSGGSIKLPISTSNAFVLRSINAFRIYLRILNCLLALPASWPAYQRWFYIMRHNCVHTWHIFIKKQLRWVSPWWGRACIYKQIRKALSILTVIKLLCSSTICFILCDCNCLEKQY